MSRFGAKGTPVAVASSEPPSALGDALAARRAALGTPAKPNAVTKVIDSLYDDIVTKYFNGVKDYVTKQNLQKLIHKQTRPKAMFSRGDFAQAPSAWDLFKDIVLSNDVHKREVSTILSVPLTMVTEVEGFIPKPFIKASGIDEEQLKKLIICLYDVNGNKDCADETSKTPTDYNTRFTWWEIKGKKNPRECLAKFIKYTAPEPKIIEKVNEILISVECENAFEEWAKQNPRLAATNAGYAYSKNEKARRPAVGGSRNTQRKRNCKRCTCKH